MAKILTKCANADCGGLFRVDRRHVGTKTRCPRCKASLGIARADGSALWGTGDVILDLYGVQHLLGRGGEGAEIEYEAHPGTVARASGSGKLPP